MMKIRQISPFDSILDMSKLPILDTNDFAFLPFDNRIFEFSNRISKRLLKNSTYGKRPELIALAFWLRKSNLIRIKKENTGLISHKNTLLSPIGMVFHVCPANVDTMFFYSLVISLTMGNKNIVRLSNRLSDPFINFLFNTLNEELETNQSKLFRNYISVIKYDHNEIINTFFSKLCDARLIWGGDNTSITFKKFVGNPRCKDIAFSDRNSFSIIKVSKFYELNEKQKFEFARLFYNDSYTFDQLGCSSPQSIFLIGSEKESNDFIYDFYSKLNDIVDKNYNTDYGSLASLKFNNMFKDVIEDEVQKINRKSNGLIFLNSSNDKIKKSCGGGYFYTYNINSVKQIKNHISRRVQTVSYFGLSKGDVNVIINDSIGLGIDRIVPIGKSLAFDYIWDGYNLCEELSSKKYIL